MANIRPRKDKSGNIVSYEIRVYKGRDENGKQLKPYTMTYKPAPNMTEKQIEKELNKQVVQFEEQCRLGISSDNKQTFQKYAEYVLQLKERAGIKKIPLYIKGIFLFFCTVLCKKSYLFSKSFIIKSTIY